MIISKKNIFFKVFYYFLIFFLGALPLLFTTSLLFLRDPPIWPDEAIYMDTARTLLKTGRLATGIFGNTIPGLEQHAYWYPPLYFYLLALWMKVFGPHIEAARALSFLLALFSLAGVGILLHKLFRNPYLTFLGILMISLDGWFSRAARVGRMDMFNFFFLVTTILLFVVAERRAKRLLYLITGIAAGIGVLIHPLFFIAPVTIGIYLFLIRGSLKEKLSAVFLIGSPVVISLFLWFLSMREAFGLFLLQYQLQIIRKEGIRNPFVLQLFSEDAYWRIALILYVVIICALAVLAAKYKRRMDFFIVLGFIISSIVLISSKEMWYVFYFQPFITLAVLSILHLYWDKKKEVFWGTLAIMLVIFFVNIHSFFSLGSLIGSEKYNYDFFGKKIVEQLPEQTKIFVATIPDPYFYFRKHTKLTVFEFPTVPVSQNAYKKLLDSVDFLILNMLPDKIVYEYIKQNTQKTTLVGERNGGGYSTTVVQLVPREKRR